MKKLIGVRSGGSPPLPYLCAVALLGAALADFFVESCSNAGLFGHRYLGNDLSSVTPTLAAGLVFALLLAWWSCARGQSGERDWVADLAVDVARRSSLGALVWTFALQLAVLFAIESCEQFADVGHLAGGTAWLGGPVAQSLTIHAVVCIAVTLLLVQLCRALGATLATIVNLAIFLSLALRALRGPSEFRLAQSTSSRKKQSAYARRTRGRAPPCCVQLVLLSH